ncbi:MAG: hypothetical protein MK100_09425 [Phycisphaerales bacterium]|nr:hypothetical protein [Phycisphaerales bacterium]
MELNQKLFEKQMKNVKMASTTLYYFGSAIIYVAIVIFLIVFIKSWGDTAAMAEALFRIEFLGGGIGVVLVFGAYILQSLRWIALHCAKISESME